MHACILMSRNLTIYFDLFLIMTLENYFNNCVRTTRRSFSFFFVYSRRVADTTDGLIYNTYHVCVVFTSNRSFYPTSAHPVSVLILHPRDTNYVVTDYLPCTRLLTQGKSTPLISSFFWYRSLSVVQHGLAN